MEGIPLSELIIQGYWCKVILGDWNQEGCSFDITVQHDLDSNLRQQGELYANDAQALINGLIQRMKEQP